MFAGVFGVFRSPLRMAPTRPSGRPQARSIPPELKLSQKGILVNVPGRIPTRQRSPPLRHPLYAPGLRAAGGSPGPAPPGPGPPPRACGVGWGGGPRVPVWASPAGGPGPGEISRAALRGVCRPLPDEAVFPAFGSRPPHAFAGAKHIQKRARRLNRSQPAPLLFLSFVPLAAPSGRFFYKNPLRSRPPKGCRGGPRVHEPLSPISVFQPAAGGIPARGWPGPRE